MADDLVTVGRGSKEPRGAVTLGTLHFQPDPSNGTDFAVTFHGPRPRDRLAARLIAGCQLADYTERIHHAGGRTTDIVNMHINVDAGNIHTEFLGIRERLFGGRFLRRGHLLIGFLIVFLGGLAGSEHRLAW